MRKETCQMILEVATKFAAENHGGDPRAVEMIRWHLEFLGARNGRPEIRPYEHEEIQFFMVGMNASHQFYMGMKDGKCYRWACGESCEIDEDGRPGFDSHVSELANWDDCHYWGHF